ncbi:MAG TPA: YhjD/YihY/BrkB family envelope integrity protein, partial [Verrucomicrobiae bacterium]|nr:YhjD/YihY/BrkB family envelope integrity protein [Verrucomicrobiae bacterium]
YGAAGALIIVLVWVYYSAQILLLGAEFAKAYSDRRQALREGQQTTQPAD